jgi:uncharacterized membrane protein YhhN
VKNRLTIAYLVLAALYLALFEYNASWLGAWVKILPILLLAAGSVWLGRGRWRSGMIGALLFSALGDWLLAVNGITGNLFAAGLGSFLVAQLLYAQLFWRARSPERRRLYYAALYLPVALGLAWITLPAAGELAPAVGAYMLAITAMVTGAAVADRPLLLFAGALVFAFSDALIALNKFVEPIPRAGLLIMLSYYLAQLLLWRGAYSRSTAHAA